MSFVVYADGSCRPTLEFYGGLFRVEVMVL